MISQRLGLALLAATAAAFFLVSTAVASAEIDTHLLMEGSGSGTVGALHEYNLQGNPPIDCHWNGESEEKTGVCDTEALKSTELAFHAVKFIETPSPGSRFVSWKVIEGLNLGCEPLTAPECGVAKGAGEIIVKATFEAIPRYLLTLKKTGSGNGTVTSDIGIPTPIDCEPGCEEEAVEAYEGEKVTFEANPDGSSAFAGWSGCDAEPAGNCEVTVSAAKEVEAEFSTVDTHVVVAGPGSGAVVPVSGEENLAGNPPIECEWDGTVEEQSGVCDTEAIDLLGNPGVKLAYEAAPGSRFSGWEIEAGTPAGCEELGESCAVDRTGAEIVVRANFELIPKFKLNLSTSGNGSGTFKCKVDGGPEEPCQAEYLEGAEVQIAPHGDVGSEFTEWSSDCSGADTEACAVTMDEEHSVGAAFIRIGGHALNLSTSGSGSGYFECDSGSGRGGCTLEYFEGEVVEVFAVGEASAFVEWSSDCSGADPEACAVTMDEEHTVNAVFVETHALGIEKTGTGTSTVQCEDLTAASGLGACTASYPDGHQIKVTGTAGAHSALGAISGTGSASACSALPCTFTIQTDSSVTVEANLIPRTLTISKAGAGTSTVYCGDLTAASGFGVCAASYPDGHQIEIVATAGAHSQLGAISGTAAAASCTASPCTFTIEADSSVTVEAGLIPRALTVATTGSGSGSVNCDGGPCAGSYPDGVEVTLSAAPASGSAFAGWSGGGCSGTGACVVTLGADTTVTAAFTKKVEPAGPQPQPEPQPGIARAAAAAHVQANEALLELTCTGGPCKGSLELTARVKQGRKHKIATIGKGSFEIPAGASQALRVRITDGHVRRLLKRGRAVRAKLEGSGIESRTVKLKPAAKKARRHHRRHTHHRKGAGR